MSGKKYSMSFKDIKSQDRAIEFLQSAIRGGKLSHAYLFVGPESIGKGLVARTLAKTLNCERKELDSCDECLSCRKIDKEIHPDVNWITPEGAGGVIKIEKIRWLKKNISLKPYEAKFKFYIVDKAHQMPNEAANSLLRTLEEPPPNSILILISDKPERLLSTIKSRCQMIRFQAMTLNELEKILEDEYNLSSDSSHFLANFSSGRIGRALALRDENILERKNQVIDGFSKENIIFNEDNLFFNNSREEISEILNILSLWYRDMLVLKSTGTAELIVNKDRVDDIKSAATKYSQEELLNILEELKKAGFLIRQNVNPKLTLSSLVLTI